MTEKGNEELDKECNSPRVLFERLPFDQNTQMSEEIKCNETQKNSEECGKDRIFQDNIFTVKHRETMTKLKHNIGKKTSFRRISSSQCKIGKRECNNEKQYTSKTLKENKHKSTTEIPTSDARKSDKTRVTTHERIKTLFSVFKRADE